MKITIELDDLKNLLYEQNVVTGESITSNLTKFSFFGDLKGDLKAIRAEIKLACVSAEFHPDIEVLEKYLK